MEIPAKIKHQARTLCIFTAIMLVPSQWNTASAQTAISFSLTGTGTGTINSFSLTGNGTFTPYGQTSISVKGGSQGGAFGVTFTVTFADQSTWTATSTANVSKNVISGTATITSGTGDFAGATGSFTYTATITAETGGALSFTVTGSGTVTTGQIYYFSDLASGGGWQTTLTYINYSPQAITCTTNFYSDSGAVLQVPFSQGTISSRTDVLQPGGSIHDQTVASATAAVSEGWAEATCGGKVQASLLYRLYQAGKAVGEASVNAETAATTKFVTFAQTQTGVAYANPSTTQSATITLTVFNSAGAQLATKTILLGPLVHGSANLGPLLGLPSFTGFVEITSTIPVISLSLNAEAAPVFSSLPPGDLPSSTTLVQ
jgi:hypothetical protein